MAHWQTKLLYFWEKKKKKKAEVKLFTTIILLWVWPKISERYRSCPIDIWAATWQNQQNGCAFSEDSDQPGHPHSLIRVLAVGMKKAWFLSYPLSAQRRLWSDWADAQADLRLRWAHTHFVGSVMSWLKYTAKHSLRLKKNPLHSGSKYPICIKAAPLILL